MGKRRGHSRMSASRADACCGTIALSYRRDARRVAQSRRCALNRLFPAWSLSPVISRAPAASFRELAGSTIVRAGAYSDLDVLGRRCRTGCGFSRMVWLATAAPRMGWARFRFLRRVRAGRRRAYRERWEAASEDRLEARSFFTSTLLCIPHVFVTNGLATIGSRVALARAQVATLAIARLCRRCHLPPTHASQGRQCADPIRTLHVTRAIE
jgi:hypothetical protein